MKTRRKFRILFLLELFFILLLACIAFGLYQYSKVQQADIDSDSLLVSLPEKEEDTMKDYINIALFGVDSRENELTSNTRSDVIMIASIHKKTKEVKLISVYRDTYLYIDEKHGYTKATHAYAYGGPELAVKMLNQNLDLNITEFATVNFNSLAAIVDALGGITVEIQEDEIKEVNRYTKDVAKIIGTEAKKIKKAGKQTLDGTQATGYCRVRYTDGGDFRRAERQRTVMQAVLKKLKKAGPIKLLKIAGSVLPQVYTSLSLGDVIKLLPGIFSYQITDSEGFPFEKTAAYLGKTSYVFANPNLEDNVSALHKTLFGTKKYTPSKRVRGYSDTIQSRR